MRTSWWLAFCISFSLALAPAPAAEAATSTSTSKNTSKKKPVAEKKSSASGSKNASKTKKTAVSDSKTSAKAKKSSTQSSKSSTKSVSKTKKSPAVATKAKSSRQTKNTTKVVLKKSAKKSNQVQKTTKVKLRNKNIKTLATVVVKAPRLSERSAPPILTPRSNASKAFLTDVFDPGQSSFHVFAKDLPFTYRVSSLYLNPQEQVDFSIVDVNKTAVFKVQTRSGKLQRLADNEYRWTAPSQSGLYRMDIHKGSERMQFNLFVLKPMPKNGVINNYSIGHYPAAAKDGDPRYTPPSGLIEVTEANKDMLISPHFRLGQFVCKQAGGYPKYLYLQERLLLKLEWLLAEVNRRGYHSPSFSVMSGYRTPFYNNRLNNVSLSRHQWGDAADIFIDNDQDGVLDDLNRDGRIDKADAEILYRLFEELEQPHPHMHGGLGIYEANAYHGPFVHIDARGTQARWGMRD